MPLNLAGLPWFLGQVIERTLANEKCTPDFPLLIAESLEECAELLPAQTVYRAPCIRVAAQLREAAPSFAKPLGKPLGDFEGNLTP